ncbi:carboxypeptidase-like regulatory domain-containing protein [Cyclobacterium jeungdonense]|uniref:Carboxypeptidase-like regulatory domain-containing protein n=1 Tax=Cyclobacterium jeungdonense TaxID=708087 RepID=A0ABT8C3I0_9BACT|nr:carboxypeptidase-like regulatory domain-containing protein [Cyclobacterium jeungdonense]MDN3686296.1 carboxypeptidase-like regulatory domain-containing protein [Cyclobacterium jeungdonense]
MKNLIKFWLNRIPFWSLSAKVWAIAMFYFFRNSLFAQQRTVTSTVTSADTGETLPGVNILIKGSSFGSATDIDGNYRIQVPSADAILSYSFIGFEVKEVRVGNNSTIDTAMEPEMSALSEVVVVGYDTQERAKVTGAISSVSSE